MVEPTIPETRWPKGSRLLQLRPQAKVPYGGATGTAHLGAVLDSEFLATGQNVGIVLEGMFVLVDLDKPGDPVAQRWAAAMEAVPNVERPGTWTQATPRQKAVGPARDANPEGRHFLVQARPGLLEAGARNKVIYSTTERLPNGGYAPVGDIKVRGYLVAPGSEIVCDDGVVRGYRAVDMRDPAPMPEWLWEYLTAIPERAAGATLADERDEIPGGEQHHALVQMAGFWRGQLGLSQAAIERLLPGMLPALPQTRPQPWTKDDFESIARSVRSWQPGIATQDPDLVGPGVTNWADQSFVVDPIEWWVEDFVPHGELTMLYGAGGCGKSTWGSWLCAEVTARGGRFGFAGIEEPAHRFVSRAVLGGGTRDSIYTLDQASRLKLPSRAQQVFDLITLHRLDVLYFDSVYSHFDAGGNSNMAERARASLGILAEIAQRTRCTIVCIFHENKDGAFLGSTEMSNVGRVFLSAKRKDGYLEINVKKTNFDEPDYGLAFGIRKMDSVDPLTGHRQMKRVNGILVPYQTNVAFRLPNTALVDEHHSPEDVETAEQTGPKKRSYARRST